MFARLTRRGRPDPASRGNARHALRMARLLHGGGLQLHFQPVIDLQSGRPNGVEALARLVEHGRLIPPDRFLPYLSDELRRDLLFRSLEQGMAALQACRHSHPGLRLSFNLDPVVLLGPGFVRTLLRRLAAAQLDPRRVTLEILESGELGNLELARRQLAELRRHGLRIALDDVGRAYASLLRLKELPVDVIKLDQGFVRGVSREPEDLQFVSSVAGLARGLGKRLVIEGVETAEILDALQVMGVEAVQGYAIARPMPAPALRDWLARHVPVPASPQPTSLLGAYAAHLNLMETCRALLNQPLSSNWLTGADDPHACRLGQFFDAHGLHDTEYGLAHKHFHTVLPAYATERLAWEQAGEALRLSLKAAITRGPLPVASESIRPMPAGLPAIPAPA